MTHLRKDSFDCLTNAWSVIAEAGVIFGQQILELSEPLLFEGVETSSASLSGRLPLDTGSFCSRATRIILSFSLKQDNKIHVINNSK